MALEFNYDRMVQKALLQVVRETLDLTAKNGLVGSHHFYLTFQTNRSDVQLADKLREKYPEEMTIVLQHQFWDLEVSETGFGVTLSFDDKHEKIWIPYVAIVNFLDPSVKFGLQFEAADPENNGDQGPKPDNKKDAASDTSSSAKVVTLDAFRKK
ncbi:MAG: hypothetical protein H2057_05635 [Alphaproteobacteria bacterium]|nr:hypothetical protein [Alphaproteobacteria bacterium]